MQYPDHIPIFVSQLAQWYARHKRILPWRDISIENDTQRSYQVLISEIMLQQTQVSRVMYKYTEFLELFPTLQALADATNKEVILVWRGMGYNNRALRLRDTAKAVCSDYDGVFPREMEALQGLPGVGHYTAAAIRNFAVNIPTPCLDTNIRRILHRSFIGPEYDDGTWQASDKDLLCIAEEVLQHAVSSGQFDARNWHAALMDYGSLVCTKRSPKWDICPLTHEGVMKAAYKELPKNPRPKKARQEPGRMVGSTHIPNRIFRGRIIDELRDAKKGLTEAEIGKRICIDWDPATHKQWLKGLIEALKKDDLIHKTGKTVVLTD